MTRRSGAVAAVTALAVLTACSAASAAPPPLPAGALPILFVHGHGGDPGVFDEMIEHLESRGYPADHLLAVQLRPDDGANVAAAREAIAPAVEELLDRAGAGPAGRVDVVAHSMGALSSRWYATRLRPDRVRSLITVGGANHGTDVLCGYPDPGGRELCPAFAADGAAAQLQIALNGTPSAPVDETPFGRGADDPRVVPVRPDGIREIRYLAVIVPDDEWITPLASSELDGADAVSSVAGAPVEQIRPGNLLLDEPLGHDAVLRDERFFAVLDAVLDEGAR